MKYLQINGATISAVSLIIVIAFASTSIAGEMCDRAFHSVTATFFGPTEYHRHGFNALHFAAEKGLHVALFWALGFSLSQIAADTRRRTAIILSVAFIVAVSSEWLQTFFPRRDPTLRDVAIDFCGAVLGLVCTRFFKERSLKTEVLPPS